MILHCTLIGAPIRLGLAVAPILLSVAVFCRRMYTNHLEEDSREAQTLVELFLQRLLVLPFSSLPHTYLVYLIVAVIKPTSSEIGATQLE